jgi:hypothetical protein
MARMSRRYILTPALLLLAVSIFWGTPAWSHPALDAPATGPVATVPTAAPTTAWSAAPVPPTLPWPAVIALVAALSLAWWRPRRALALALVVVFTVLAFENGVHSVHHLSAARHFDDLRSGSTCPVAAAANHLAGTPVDGPVQAHLVPTAPDRVFVQQPLRQDNSDLAAHQGRAPPLSA